jgi:hypothetical protein
MNEEQLRQGLSRQIADALESLNPAATIFHTQAFMEAIDQYVEARVKGITLPPIPLKLVIGFLGHRAKCPLTQREYMFHEGQVSIRVRISMEEIGKATTLEEASVIIENDRNNFLRGHLP